MRREPAKTKRHGQTAGTGVFQGAATSGNAMKFIEMTGRTLRSVVTEGDLPLSALRQAGVEDDSIVRVNEQGDIEVRRANRWDIVGGLLGDFDQRIKGQTGLDWI